jgi:hypothetical protein
MCLANCSSAARLTVVLEGEEPRKQKQSNRKTTKSGRKQKLTQPKGRKKERKKGRRRECITVLTLHRLCVCVLGFFY